MNRLLALLMVVLWSCQSQAQITNNLSVSTGSNQTSFGQFTKVADQLSYHYQDWSFSGAAGWVFSDARPNYLDALRFDISKDFMIKDRPFNGVAFYQWRPFSERLHELNAGVLFNYQTKTQRWDFYLGAHSRVFRIPNNYAKAHHYNVQNLWQVFNLIYKITFHQPLTDKLKLNASVTNYDNFILQQETNPFVMVDLEYKASERSQLYLDLAYLQAGFFNIRVNYFGYFVKLGYQYTPVWGGKKKEQ